MTSSCQKTCALCAPYMMRRYAALCRVQCFRHGGGRSYMACLVLISAIEPRILPSTQNNGQISDPGNWHLV